jgi:hypothetical protein
MSHFYGTLKGSRGVATRCGTKNTGLTTHAAGWRGAIRVTVHHGADGRDRFEVQLVPWHGSGGRAVKLAEGVLDARGTRQVDACVADYTMVEAPAE